MTGFNISECYSLAWKAFSKWWIPLSLISLLIIVFQIIPQIMSHSEIIQIKKTAFSLIEAVVQNDIQRLDILSLEILEKTNQLSLNFIKIAVYLFPLTALLSIILIMKANLAVKDSAKRERSYPELIYISLVHIFYAIIKLFAFFFFIIPGFYLYIKLLFVSLIMLEEKKGVKEATIESWTMTAGNFWRLFALVALNTGIQGVAASTVIGAVPATAFVNTARAAAYRQLLESKGDERAEAF